MAGNHWIINLFSVDASVRHFLRGFNDRREDDAARFLPSGKGLVVAGGGGSVEAIVQHGQAGCTPFSECTETWQQNMQREERNRENVGNIPWITHSRVRPRPPPTAQLDVGTIAT